MADGSPNKQDIMSATQPIESPGKTIQVVVKNVMEGVPVICVQMRTTSLVRDLKVMIADKCEVYPDKQLLLYKDKELRDDDSQLSSYGIDEDCTVTMNVKMNTGTMSNRGAASELVLYVPMMMPQGNVGSLRHAIRGMNNVKNLPRRKKTSKTDEKAHIWTPEKEMEHHLTRNRMKTLLRNRKPKTNVLSDTPTDSNNGSVLGSRNGSTISSARSHSPCQTPPPEAQTIASGPTSDTENKKDEGGGKEITEKELKLFYPPPESLQQLKMMGNDLWTPPQNQKELEELKKKLAAVEKTRCKICRKRLPIADQTMPCLCQNVFCARHRDPDQHLCNIDYKQTGRSKLVKENPKCDGGGTRKAK